MSRAPDSVAAFAGDLSELRRRAGRSVRDVGRATGIPSATLGGYFAGRHLPPANRPEVLEGVLRACQVPEGERAAWRRRLLDLHEQRRQVVTRTPYPGLRPFGAEEHDLFFGREELLDRLLGLVQAVAGSTRPLVVVVGPSGSGKSSLLRAGLQPALADAGCTVLTPTQVRARRPGPADDADQSDGAVGEVLVVDQLEELWTHPDLRARAEGFVADLVAWADASPGRAVVLGLRADFYGEAMTLPDLAAALQHHQLLVEPLGLPEMRSAIEGPARQVGLVLEQGLADVILADVRPDTVGSVLPHLAHVLDTMWRSSDRRALTVAGYQEAGGFEGAIRQSAEEVLASLPSEQRELAMLLLLRMVTTAPAQGWTRRLVPLEELLAADPDARAVLDHLVDGRLVVVRTDDATLSHESLVGAWPRLREAVDARRGDLARREAVERAARDWDAAGRGEDHLLRGSRLQAVDEWRSTAQDPLTPLQEDYVEASRQLAERMADEQAASRRRSRVLSSVLALLLVATTVASLVALRWWDRANDERDQAQSRQMAVAAENLRERDPLLSRQLALAAYRTAPTREGRSALLDATTSPVLGDWADPEGAVLDRAVPLPDGDHLVLAGAAGGVLVVRHAEGETGAWEVVARLPDVVEGAGAPSVVRLAAHPDRPWVVVAGTAVPAEQQDGAATAEPLLAVLDLTDPSDPVAHRLEVPAAPTALTFADGGRSLVVAADGVLHRYAVGAGGGGVAADARRQPPVGPEPVDGTVDVGVLVEALGSGDDGRVVAAARADGTVVVWEVPEGSGELEEVGELDTGRDLFDLDVDADGGVVAAVGRSGLVHWIEVAADGLEETHRPYASDTNLFAVEIDDGSGLLAAAGWDGEVSLWRLGPDGPVSESPSLVLPSPRPVFDVAVVQGRWLFTTMGGTTYTWDSQGSALPRLAGNVFTVAASAGGDRWLTATGPPDGAVQVWDAWRPHAPRLLHTLRPGVGDTSTGTGAIGHDGSVVATGTTEGRVVVWELEGTTSEVVVDLPVSDEGVPLVLLTHDAERVVSVGRDGRVAVVGLTGQERGRLLDEVTVAGEVFAAAVREDGLLAVADETGEVRLVHVDDPQRTLGRIDTGLTVYGADFSPDGATLALAASDDRVHLHDVSDPARPTQAGSPLSGPTAIANGVRFAPDGDRLAVAVSEGEAWIWTRGTDRWRPTEVLGAGLPNLQDVAWSPDGSVLLGGGLSGRTRLWLTDVEEATSSVCGTVRQDITEEEWEGLLPGTAYRPPCADDGG